MTDRTLEGPTWHLDRGVAIPAGTTISARFVGGTVSGTRGHQPLPRGLSAAAATTSSSGRRPRR